MTSFLKILEIFMQIVFFSESYFLVFSLSCILVKICSLTEQEDVKKETRQEEKAKQKKGDKFIILLIIFSVIGSIVTVVVFDELVDKLIEDIPLGYFVLCVGIYFIFSVIVIEIMRIYFKPSSELEIVKFDHLKKIQKEYKEIEKNERFYL